MLLVKSSIQTEELNKDRSPGQNQKQNRKNCQLEMFLGFLLSPILSPKPLALFPLCQETKAQELYNRRGFKGKIACF